MSIAFTKADVRRIRWSALLLVVLVALGAGVVYLSLQLTQSAKLAAKKVDAERTEFRNKLSRARDEEQEIRAKIDHYRNLLDRGLITTEERLDWVERIATIKSARKLIDVQYELSPQKPVEAALLPEGAAGGGHEFMASSMRLQLQLLHENDLLGFLADLRQNVHALLVVRDCDIERLPPTVAGERATNAQLKAACTIDWITLREKK